MSDDAFNLESVIVVTFVPAALLAHLSDQSPEVVDSAMARLGGTMLRRPEDDVEAEIAAAEKAQREAKKEARKQLLKARHHKHMDEIHAKLAELKAKLHRHKKAATAGS